MWYDEAEIFMEDAPIGDMTRYTCDICDGTGEIEEDNE